MSQWPGRLSAADVSEGSVHLSRGDGLVESVYVTDCCLPAPGLGILVDDVAADLVNNDNRGPLVLDLGRRAESLDRALVPLA